MASIVKPERVLVCCGNYYVVLISCKTKKLYCPTCGGVMNEVKIPHIKYIK